MADAGDIVRYSHADCFWLCDGSLKVYEVPHPWQNPQQIYFGSAAVNVGNRMDLLAVDQLHGTINIDSRFKKLS